MRKPAQEFAASDELQFPTVLNCLKPRTFSLREPEAAAALAGKLQFTSAWTAILMSPKKVWDLFRHLAYFIWTFLLCEFLVAAVRADVRSVCHLSFSVQEFGFELKVKTQKQFIFSSRILYCRYNPAADWSTSTLTIWMLITLYWNKIRKQTQTLKRFDAPASPTHSQSCGLFV